MRQEAAIANFFIGRGIGEGIIDNCAPKVMALCWFAHGWMLGVTGRPLFSRPWVAMATGPQHPVLDRILAPFGNSPIKDLLHVSIPDPKVPGRLTRGAPVVPSGHPLLLMLGKVWSGFGRIGSYSLGELLCAPGTPWAATWYGGDPPQREGTVIADEDIREYFARHTVRRGGRLEISVDALQQRRYEFGAGGRVDED